MHLGGESALDMARYAHYLSLEARFVPIALALNEPCPQPVHYF